MSAKNRRGCGADKTVRTGGHGKPSEKLPGRKGRTAVYRGGTQAGSAGARSDGFAKTKEAAADLSRQVQTKMADKFYYAVTDGVPEQKKGTLEDYLLRDGKTNTSKVVSKSTEGAKSARLDYEVTAQNKTNAILRIRLDTGSASSDPGTVSKCRNPDRRGYEV